jgi:hypothetical protein
MNRLLNERRARNSYLDPWWRAVSASAVDGHFRGTQLLLQALPAADDHQRSRAELSKVGNVTPLISERSEIVSDERRVQLRASKSLEGIENCHRTD